MKRNGNAALGDAGENNDNYSVGSADFGGSVIDSSSEGRVTPDHSFIRTPTRLTVSQGKRHMVDQTCWQQLLAPECLFSSNVSKVIDLPAFKRSILADRLDVTLILKKHATLTDDLEALQDLEEFYKTSAQEKLYAKRCLENIQNHISCFQLVSGALGI